MNLESSDANSSPLSLEAATNIGYRYPGVRPFTEKEKNMFFGRDEESRKLLSLIMAKDLVILFAKSGRGKSSLINASVIPALLEEHHPDSIPYVVLNVRIGAVYGDMTSPGEKVVQKLNEVINILESDVPSLENISSKKGLWFSFKKAQMLEPNKRFILIFDQFEEFFNYPKDVQEVFRWELAALRYNTFPKIIWENINEYTSQEYAELTRSLDIKILFSLRSDRLSHMHSMRDALPDIFRDRFELSGLTLEQAKKAIILPAIHPNTKFNTRPFIFDDLALDVIFQELLENKSDYERSIETFQLQMICQACESKVEDIELNGGSNVVITKENLPLFDTLYADYYKRQLQRVPTHRRLIAQTLIEDHLMSRNKNGENLRLSVDKNVLEIASGFEGVSEVLIEIENAFLIRRESNSVNGYNYEISHDSLLDAIAKSKEERKAKLYRIERFSKILRQIKNGIPIFLFSAVLLMIYVNYSTLYLSFKIISNQSERPVIENKEKLQFVISRLTEEVIKSVRQIDVNNNINTWEASQLMTALYNIEGFDGSGDIKRHYLRLARRTLDKQKCVWREMVNIDDIRATSWIVSANGTMGLIDSFSCTPIKFLLENQDSSGAWPMFISPLVIANYNSTYATAHVLRALHNSSPSIRDSILLKQVKIAVGNGLHWLLNNVADVRNSRWSDYQQNGGEYESLAISKSLSGLAVHTLNMLDSSNEKVNKNWLKNLTASEAYVDINLRERSDKALRTERMEVAFVDATRHLVVPWQLIATIDAYKSGDFSQKLKANKWVNLVIENLNSTEIAKTDRFAKAELLIALRYLGDENYHFK